MRIGILSAGGDCPGINATIRGVGKTAILEYGMDVIGFRNGYSGLLYKDYYNLNEDELSGLLTIGGTILGTSREKPFKKMEGDIIADKPKIIKRNYDELGLDCLVCIGGNGTQNTAAKFAELGMNVIGIPKTIDNDIYGTDVTFGFDSALTIATDAIDKLHSTANSHRRVMVIEIMGHHAGWLTLHSGMATGSDIILLPEIPFDVDVVCSVLKERAVKGKAYSIVAVAEGIKTPKKKDAARYIAKQITEKTGLETRETKLGYIQRGGSPSAYDRILSTQFGSHAAKLISEGKYGRMVSLLNGQITDVALDEVGGKLRLVDPEHPLVLQAKKLGVCFGDSCSIK